MLVNVSLDMTVLVEMAHKGHSAFNIGKNGKTYCNVQVWVNDEPDKFGDHASLQLNSAKGMAETDRKLHPINPKDNQPGKVCYVGRGKKSDLSPKPLDQASAAALTLPGQQAQQPAQQTQQAQQSGNGWQRPATGLPF